MSLPAEGREPNQSSNACEPVSNNGVVPAPSCRILAAPVTGLASQQVMEAPCSPVLEADLVSAKEAVSRAKHELLSLQTKRNLAASLVSSAPFAALDSNASAELGACVRACACVVHHPRPGASCTRIAEAAIAT